MTHKHFSQYTKKGLVNKSVDLLALCQASLEQLQQFTKFVPQDDTVFWELLSDLSKEISTCLKDESNTE